MEAMAHRNRLTNGDVRFLKWWPACGCVWSALDRKWVGSPVKKNIYTGIKHKHSNTTYHRVLYHIYCIIYIMCTCIYIYNVYIHVYSYIYIMSCKNKSLPATSSSQTTSCRCVDFCPVAIEGPSDMQRCKHCRKWLSHQPKTYASVGAASVPVRELASNLGTQTVSWNSCLVDVDSPKYVNNRLWPISNLVAPCKKREQQVREFQ